MAASDTDIGVTRAAGNPDRRSTPISVSRGLAVVTSITEPLSGPVLRSRSHDPRRLVRDRPRRRLVDGHALPARLATRWHIGAHRRAVGPHRHTRRLPERPHRLARLRHRCSLRSRRRPLRSYGEQLRFFAELSGLSGASAEATGRWLDRLGLADRADARLEELSHGNQQRVQFAAALIHDRELAVLDEPFSGLDPLGVEATRRTTRSASITARIRPLKWGHAGTQAFAPMSRIGWMLSMRQEAEGVTRSLCVGGE